MFKIFRLEDDSNIFVIKKHAVKNSILNSSPSLIYGFLKVEGEDYFNSSVSYKNISAEISQDELANLVEMTLLEFWQVD